MSYNRFPNPGHPAPITPPSSVRGLNVPLDAAQAGAQPFTDALQQNQDKEDANTQAARFQQLMNTGYEGMQKYVTDLAQEDPETAQDAAQQLQLLAPHLGTMKGDDLKNTVFNFYDSVNNQRDAKRQQDMFKNGVPDTTPGAAPDATRPANERDILATQHVEPKVAITALGQEETRQMKAQAEKDKQDYQNRFLQTKKSIADLDNSTKMRLQTMRTSKTGKGYEYQLKVEKQNLDDTQKNMDDLQKEIDQTKSEDPAVKPDASGKLPDNIAAEAMREAYGWNARRKIQDAKMKELTREKDAHQRRVEQAMAKGAGDSDWLPADATQGAPGASATPPTASMPKPSSTAPDDTVKAWIGQYYPKAPQTPEVLSQWRTLRRKEEQGGQ